MGLDIGSLVAGGFTDAAKGISDVLHSWITTKKDKAIEDADAKELDLQVQQFMMEHSLKVMEVVARADESQTMVNAKEAESGSLFVSGWRPAVGWVCVVGLLVKFLIAPLFTWITGLFHNPIAFPDLDTGTMVELLIGMLGLSGMRTVEKIKGVASTSLVQ